MLRVVSPETVQDTTVTTLPLTPVQATAVDLYWRGLNVFPLPSVWEWRALKSESPGNDNRKPPYLLTPLFTSRLHYCGLACAHLPPGITFIDLFTHTNIGLMCGRTSGNLIGIDCDSQTALESIGGKLTKRDLPFWSLQSHRGGTYLLRLVEGEAVNMPFTQFPCVQVWAMNHYLVMPPSVHPQGTIYRWLTPEPRFSLPVGQSLPPVSVTALDWLGVRLNRKSCQWQPPDLLGLPVWAGALSQRNRETLAFGAPEGQRNSRLAAASYDLAGNDIPYDEAEVVILEAASLCNPPYPNRDAIAIVKSAYSRSRQPARKIGQTVTLWQKAQGFAIAFDWRRRYGRVALRRRAVFFACIERSRLDHSRTWRASLRELSELAYQGIGAVQAALRDFQRDGLIVRVGQSASGASLYSFNIDCPVSNTVPPLANNSVSPTVHPKTSFEKDVFGRLGLTSWSIWRYLLQTPAQSIGQVARVLNLPRSSVYDAFKRLRNCGLVTFNPSESIYFGESLTGGDFENLALSMGVYGHSENRRRKYQDERERRANHLVARARKNWVYASHERSQNGES